MRKEKVVKLALSYQDAHIVTIMLQGSGYPHILDQFNEANRKAAALRFWELVKYDFRNRQWGLLFSRFKNWRMIRAKYK